MPDRASIRRLRIVSQCDGVSFSVAALPVTPDPDTAFLLSLGAVGEHPVPSPAGASFARLRDLARVHGLLPLLQVKLEHLEGGTPSPEERAALRSECVASTLRNRLAVQTLVQLMEAWENGGVRAVVHKGPALAAALYDGAGLRPFDDIDVVVSEEALADALRIARDVGFRPASGRLSPARERAQHAAENQIALTDADALVHLDLHWQLLPRRFPIALGLPHRLQSVEIGGRSMPMLDRAELLIALTAHGGKDNWRKLVWVVDVARLLNRAPPDWSRCLDEARVMGATRVLRVGLALASLVPGTVLPGDVEAAIGGDEAVLRLARRFAAPSSARPTPLFDCLEMRHVYFELCERRRDAWAYVAASLFMPNASDWTRLSLPDPLFGLYRLLRPIRLGLRGLRYAVTGRVSH